jgi:hypothetical protein
MNFTEFWQGLKSRNGLLIRLQNRRTLNLEFQFRLCYEQQSTIWVGVEQTLVLVSVSVNAFCKRHIEFWLFFLSATSCHRRYSHKILSQLLLYHRNCKNAGKQLWPRSLVPTTRYVYL